MHRLRTLVALLLLALWAPAVSHCLLEEVLGGTDVGCCDGGGSAPDHSECATCISVENGQLRSEPLQLPAPDFSAEDHRPDPLPVIGIEWQFQSVAPRNAGAPPVAPADLIRQATVARPVRGPSALAA